MGTRGWSSTFPFFVIIIIIAVSSNDNHVSYGERNGNYYFALSRGTPFQMTGSTSEKSDLSRRMGFDLKGKRGWGGREWLAEGGMSECLVLLLESRRGRKSKMRWLYVDRSYYYSKSRWLFYFDGWDGLTSTGDITVLIKRQQESERGVKYCRWVEWSIIPKEGD